MSVKPGCSQRLTLKARPSRAERRAIVTENVADYAAEREMILIFAAELARQRRASAPWPDASTTGHEQTPTLTSNRTGPTGVTG